MKYNIGDKVRFMDFDGDGTVLAVKGQDWLVIEVDGMEMQVSASEVVQVGAGSLEEESHLYDGNNQLSRYKPRPRPAAHAGSGGKKSRKAAYTMEVDLHIGKIRERYPAARNIPDDECLSVQLEVFDKSMAEAFRKGFRSVVFIHGNGRGILRKELERRLRDYPGVTYCDASMLRYGSGAMEVFLK